MPRLIYNNPFFTGIEIPEELFCDREQETALIIKHITNGSNIVLKSPRRLGKSSLIKHVLNQHTIKAGYNTLYIDIYGTKNAADFQFEFQSRLLSAPFAKGTRLKKEFEAFAKSAYLDFGSVDSSGQIHLPRLGFSPGYLPRLSLKEMFDFLKNTEKPNIVVIDEFQQIQEYPERMSAILRSYIQEMGNTRFIFSGSSRHMLTTMFQLSNQPFYKSAESMDLDIIPLNTYTEFCGRMFAMFDKAIEKEAVELAYFLFSGETYLMQELMKEVFSSTATGKAAGVDSVKAAVTVMMERKDSDYRDILNRLNSKKERNTLLCIANEGIGRQLTASATMKKYELDNASSVQNALKNLGEENLNIISKIEKGVYTIQDRLFELWIADKGGYLERKYTEAAQRFKEQQSLEKSIPTI